MEIRTDFNCSEDFLPIVIEVLSFKDGGMIHHVTDKVPHDGEYADYVFGIWNIHYKILAPNKSLKIQ